MKYENEYCKFCSRRTTHLCYMDISVVLFNICLIFFFTMYLECNWTSPKMHKKVSKWIKQSKRCIIKRSYAHHIDLSRYVSDCTVAYLT